MANTKTKKLLLIKYEELKKLKPKLYMLNPIDQEKIMDYLNNPNVKQIRKEKTIQQNIDKINGFIKIIKKEETKKVNNVESNKDVSKIIKDNKELSKMMQKAGLRTHNPNFFISKEIQSEPIIVKHELTNEEIVRNRESIKEEKEMIYESLIASYDNILNSLVVLLELKNAVSTLEEKQSEIDSKLQDLMHFIELYELNDPMRNHNIVQTIKQLRLERRKAKDLRYISNILNNSKLDDIEKIAYRERIYTPRIYTSLFEENE